MGRYHIYPSGNWIPHLASLPSVGQYPIFALTQGTGCPSVPTQYRAIPACPPINACPSDAWHWLSTLTLPDACLPSNKCPVSGDTIYLCPAPAASLLMPADGRDEQAPAEARHWAGTPPPLIRPFIAQRWAATLPFNFLLGDNCPVMGGFLSPNTGCNRPAMAIHL